MGDNFNHHEWFRKQRLSENASFDSINRMEGLANVRDLKLMQDSLRILTSEWMKEGFEKEDIKEYVSYLITLYASIQP